jgi:S1-C subfamily serine protease
VIHFFLLNDFRLVYPPGLRIVNDGSDLPHYDISGWYFLRRNNKNVEKYPLDDSQGEKMKIRQSARGKLILVFLIGSILLIALSSCAGPPGSGITGAEVNDQGHLVLSLSNGQTIDAGSVTAPPASPVQTGSTMTMGDLFSLIQPVIVRIDVEGAGILVSGSGVIIRSDGYVITNAHVIDQSQSITVTFNNDRQFPANVVSSDSGIDLAILKLTGEDFILPVASLGADSDVAVGGVVIAAGYPIGLDLPGPASFTQGIISAIRTLNGQRYIQSDVTLNPGNSGGALVTRSSGKVIGITTAAVIPRGENVQGIGLAIPIDVMQTYIQNNLK